MNERVIPLRPTLALADLHALQKITPTPRLLIDTVNPNKTVAALRDILAERTSLFQRGGPVRLVQDEGHGGVVARMLTPESVIRLAHDVCRPYAIRQKGGVDVEVDVALPRSIAVMYLDLHGELKLRALNGIVSSPLLQADGTIVVGKEYDALKGLWCDDVPDLSDLVPDRPTRQEAENALRTIRRAFCTFCFADAVTVYDADLRADTVDQAYPPGADESGFLTALLTAITRPSLDLAPAFLFRAPSLSGAGTGKGLLVRCICTIAFGRQPHAVTSGRNAEELDKRIAAELLQGAPVMFLDNLNNTVIRNDLLASAITEKTARVRMLGRSEMLPINTTCFVVVTGNGVSVSEDLARRFLTVEFDAGTEDPESREFGFDIAAAVQERRRELLAAALAIWRWGRQTDDLRRGKPLGGFDTWARWVRDPLMALDCRDPVVRISETKQRDGLRAVIGEILATWYARHQDRAVKLRDLHDDVVRLVDPKNRGRQFISHRLETLTRTRAGGYALTRQSPLGRHGVATYAVEVTVEGVEHQGHQDRQHRGVQSLGVDVLAAKADGAADPHGDVGNVLAANARDDPDALGDPVDVAASNAADDPDASDEGDVQPRPDIGMPPMSATVAGQDDFDWEAKP